MKKFNTPLSYLRLPTPLGTITLAATAKGLAGLWFDDQKHHPGDIAQGHIESGARPDPDNALLRQGAAELKRYFAGELQVFSVALDPQGTDFQQRVWALLRAISFGQLSSYGALAQQLKQPQAARAVGAAVGRNPLSIIVPCHRVVGRDGSLTGYAGGLPRKQHLLRLEGSLQTESAALQGSLL